MGRAGAPLLGDKTKVEIIKEIKRLIAEINELLEALNETAE